MAASSAGARLGEGRCAWPCSRRTRRRLAPAPSPPPRR